MKYFIFLLCTVLPFVELASAATYSLSDTITGAGFYDAFNWHSTTDPSHGRVVYVNQTASKSLNLTYASSNSFILRTDFKTVLDASGPGRNSVRLKSKKTYTTHVVIFDVRHMPQGCATWPAIWETKEAGWPNGGEVDILEGVNDRGPNAAALHTSAGCTMPANRSHMGTPLTLDCTKGCNVRFPTSQSFGPTFNKNGGGWFAMERTTTFIKIWFWPRSGASVPADITNPGNSVNTGLWGIPAALFSDDSCDLASHFSNHNIIINLTLCGDWAGTVYGQSGCPSTCVDFVNKNPASFVDAYFDIATARVYV